MELTNGEKSLLVQLLNETQFRGNAKELSVTLAMVSSILEKLHNLDKK